jgi:hypothetical protein
VEVLLRSSPSGSTASPRYAGRARRHNPGLIRRSLAPESDFSGLDQRAGDLFLLHVDLAASLPRARHAARVRTT